MLSESPAPRFRGWPGSPSPARPSIALWTCCSIGLQTIPLPEAVRTKLKLSNPSAVIILSVEPGGAADKAGALVGDILVSLGATTVEDVRDVYALLDPGSVGKQLPAQIIRAGAAHTLTLKVEERPER
ncbi:MAG: hypothetical protein DMG21_02610 [Acidobacteria bacterium]|nr:MAG: hypothetical protein DMG21_02610 [Acidobacteriota bacterium]